MNDHIRLLNSIDALVLDIAREHQNGRASSDDSNASTFNFTEGWFRTAGDDASLYDLDSVV